MEHPRDREVELLAAFGLALGAVFGLAGTLVADDFVRQVLWAVDGVGIIVATALLAVRFGRIGDDAVSAGFLVFALGETLLVGGPRLAWSGASRRSAAGSLCGPRPCC